MIPITVKQLTKVTQGILQKIDNHKAKNLWINEIITNSRQKTINGLFIALKGKYFDGHNFAKEAISNGATALLVEHILTIKCPQIIVKDTRLAMGYLATWVRLQSKAKVIGITGSSGKTIVKNMVSSILSQCGLTLFTEGNFNNDIGVSLTLFNLTIKHKYIVIEIGASYFGEIAYITNIVKPDSVLVNNLFAAHIEGFGSLSGVAEEKGKIFQGLNEKGTAVINLYSNNYKNWKSYFKQYQIILYFSITKQQYSNFYAKNIIMESKGSKFDLYTPIGVTSIYLPLIGKHNISNALAASALAISVGATIEQISFALSNIKPILGRLYPINLAPGKIILDDTYNANTGSMIAAAHVLSHMPGYRIFVVSDINELGNNTSKYHKEIGIITKQIKLNLVLSIGKQSIFISKYSNCGNHVSSKKKLINKLIFLIKKYKIISILIKGSRSTKMEDIVHALQEYFL
ncbi:MAG: UDP-N-acetylmuramoyl-tripeptide--D-alanyl-D-alanine ligase [Arsenophonus endosymbiont of Ceratovacuna japonica]